VDLIGYDQNGVPESDATGVEGIFRWWLTVEQGDLAITSNPALRWIHSGSAGIDHILTPAFLNRDITLTNSSGVHAPSIAEWVVATMLFLEKDLGKLLAQQRQHIWEKVERPELSTRTVVIIGAGAIASAIAQRLRPFGPRLITVRRSSNVDPTFDETFVVEELHAVVPRADWLIVAVPLSAETRNLVDSEILSAMKGTARLVNVARGEIVEETALLHALKSKAIAGAVLDVLEHEPPATDHPFWDMDNVLLLPHTTWRSPEVRERQLALFLDNLQRFVKGTPLRNVVAR
jgi:phosphoglycerate dehydrogenase-like enzyme